MEALERRPYGKTVERVTVIGMGGNPLFYHSFDEGADTIHRALELGINYFETSPFYADGVSQAILGEALRGRAEEYILAAKIGHFAKPARFRSIEALHTQMEENLRILRHDRVDVLLIHEADENWWWSDNPSPVSYDFTNASVMQHLKEAKEQGICRFTGITGNSTDKLAGNHLSFRSFLQPSKDILTARDLEEVVQPLVSEGVPGAQPAGGQSVGAAEQPAGAPGQPAGAAGQPTAAAE